MAGEKANDTVQKGRKYAVSIPGLGEVDGRTREAWTYRRLVEDVATDLGGLDRLSRAQLEHARRAAGLGVLLARLEARIVEGQEVDVSELVALANAQSRTLARLGLERRQRDATPDLRTYIEQNGEPSDAD
jgi:hypothetical protein